MVILLGSPLVFVGLKCKWSLSNPTHRHRGCRLLSCFTHIVLIVPSRTVGAPCRSTSTSSANWDVDLFSPSNPKSTRFRSLFIDWQKRLIINVYVGRGTTHILFEAQVTMIGWQGGFIGRGLVKLVVLSTPPGKSSRHLLVR